MALPSFPKFDVFNEENSLGSRWEKYTNKLENLFNGLNITANKRKKALLLHYSGDDVYDIYETLDLNATDDNYDAVKTKLTEHFSPRKNTQFEIYEFRNMRQSKCETIDQFTVKLRQKAKNCEFTNEEAEIKSQLIQGMYSQKLRTKCLQDSEKPLKDLLIMARTTDISQQQAKSMQNGQDPDGVNKVYKKSKPPYTPRHHTQTSKPSASRYPTHTSKQHTQQRPSNKCRNCGGNYPHKNKCPAFGTECFYCHQKNHFISVCQKRLQNTNRPIHQINNESKSDESEDELSFGIEINKINSKLPKFNVKVNNLDVHILIDTGSSLNIINENLLSRMKPKPKLEKCQTQAFAFAQKSAIPIKGKVQCIVETDTVYATTDFHIVKNNTNSILSYETAVELGIIPAIGSVNQHVSSHEIYEEFPSVFNRLGKLKDVKIKFHVDDRVTPVAQPPRRIPFHVRDQVEKELDRLEQMDVIEKVEGPTPWVSNLVIAPKPKSPGEIRLCVDMRQANQAIRRERHITPTVDDIIFNLNGSTVFSKVDLYKGFHQIEIDENSRNMTTFSTHVGLRRYKRLNFGVSSAPEIFQNEIRQVLEGLNGVLNISDDIVIHGENQKQHDDNLRALFRRLQEHNLTLNKQKCVFSKSQITFYGYVFSASGISPDPEKVTAIKNVVRPENPSEVRSFLGMTNYLSRFIDSYSSLTEPLRQLTKHDIKFEWTESQEKAFIKLKDVLSSDKVMTYFDPKKNTELWVDASPVGVSGILLQENKVVAYGSKALNETEKRYSQTEREALSCVWACEHFHLYLYGKAFTLITDHRPLESIFNNLKKTQSARLERWRLRLTTYKYKVTYRPGSINISDYLSRHPNLRHAHTSIAEDYVNFISGHALKSNSMRLVDVAEATENDNTIRSVIRALDSNDWKNPQKCHIDSFNCYKQLSHELAVVHAPEGTVLLRGTRLCIPEKLQNQVVMLSHEGHQGRVKTKSLLRETCWFPYMDKTVDEICKNCIPCQAATTTCTAEPIKPTPLPSSVWDEVSIDFFGPINNGEYLMVVIDDYSRYPLVEKLKSTSADAVIPRLETIFAMFGQVSIVRTDNGPPFQGHKFKEFAEHMGFKHKKITPLHPKGNAIVESFMKPMAKAIKTANANGENYKNSLRTFLLNYRNTPHSTTQISPSEIMFGRKLKTKLPKFKVNKPNKTLIAQDRKMKLKNKQYSDQKRNAKPRNIRIGDTVLIKRQQYGKMQTPFHEKPGIIVKINGSMITIDQDGKIITRDISHFKNVPKPTNAPANTLLQSDTLRKSTRFKLKPFRYR